MDGRVATVAQLPENAESGAERVRRTTARGEILPHELQHVATDRGRSELAIDQDFTPRPAGPTLGVSTEGLQDMARVLRRNTGLPQAGAECLDDHARLGGPNRFGATSQAAFERHQPGKLFLPTEKRAVCDAVRQTHEASEGAYMRPDG